MPRCQCGLSHLKHLKGRGCEEGYRATHGLKQVSDKQAEDQQVLNEMRKAHLALQHELYGESRCEAAGQLKHTCWGQLVLDHVELKATRALKFSMANTQILCEIANGLKGSKRTDYRNGRIKKELAERWPNGWEE